MVTAYYALRCRMADALGVDVDARSQQDAALVHAFTFRPDIRHEGPAEDLPSPSSGR